MTYQKIELLAIPVGNLTTVFHVSAVIQGVPDLVDTLVNQKALEPGKKKYENDITYQSISYNEQRVACNTLCYDYDVRTPCLKVSM